MSSQSSTPRAASAPNPIAQGLTLIAGLLMVCALAGVLVAAFVLPLVTGASAVAKDGVNLFNSLPTELDVEPLNEASRIEAADGSLLATFYSENRIMVPLDKIDDDLEHAVIAVEDRRFYEHNGVDIQGTLRAAASNVAGSSLQGGSTLTQQYVKNALLMDAFQRGDEEAMKKATESTIIRKIREAKIAISLEKEWSKDQILNAYLNVAQFGPSQYGVEVAAQHYFSKSAEDLTPGEAALLAGITNSPNNYDPVSHPENATKRRNAVLGDMHELGYISKEDYEKHVDQKVEDMLKVTRFRAGCADAKGRGFFCDYVTRSLLNDPAFGETPEARQKLLYGGGLTIKTTLDPKRQAIAEKIVNRKVPADDPDGFGHAIVTVEPGTGKILVMAQNRTYNPFQDAGKGETALNYTTPKHLGGGNGFAVGSTFKPFVLATFLSDGGTIWDQFQRGWGTFNDFPAYCLPNGKWQEPAGWTLRDAGATNRTGSMTALDATKFSINTAYARIALETDICKVGDLARAMGVVPGDWNDSAPGNKDKNVLEVYGANKLAPSVQVIGQVEIPAVNMAAAYGTFAAEGKYCAPTAITEITNRAGEKLPFTGGTCEQVLDKKVADTVAWTLQQGLQDPKGTGQGKIIPGHPAGGKTGTSNNFYHTWYVGMSRNLSTAVWFGNPTSDTPPGGTRVDGRRLGSKVWGATVSLPTWQEFMIEAHKGLESKPFPKQPSGKPKPAPQPQPKVAQPRQSQPAPRPTPAPKQSQEAPSDNSGGNGGNAGDDGGDSGGDNADEGDD